MGKERLPEYVVKTIEIFEQQRERPVGAFEVLQEIFMNDFTHTDMTFSPQFDKTFLWIAESGRNICRLLRAFENGYEIEKQKKYRVKIDSKLYFQRFENIEAVFVIDDSLGVKESSPVFTREVGNKILEILGVESGQLEEAEDY
ncbi:DUF1642 domain-containing protein [Pediococcus pentosaceus]|uniref:DUF1642 domain-containing protein n=1 Tax=Pediococcus pentosaceus TaxID=1255 RepID=UPI00223B78F7|nr:DUF1642 domain-containing protein [Pediococcus pentosaceus]MCS8562717.1 DUF1642 domain-containing protein [Pediococcus pentosaceus]MCS8566932.1 DUF1642 domain-containing protein [Pediococcus pentosaceus]MCS8579795.1 DUF1642 domain-containing protein [Pediococcus pentosaceus]